MSVQARIPAGLAAVHNFIIEHDETGINNYLDEINSGVQSPDISMGELGQGPIPQVEKERAEVFRDKIALAMWNSYQEYLREHPDYTEEYE